MHILQTFWSQYHYSKKIWPFRWQCMHYMGSNKHILWTYDIQLQFFHLRHYLGSVYPILCPWCNLLRTSANIEILHMSCKSVVYKQLNLKTNGRTYHIWYITSRYLLCTIFIKLHQIKWIVFIIRAHDHCSNGCQILLKFPNLICCTFSLFQWW